MPHEKRNLPHNGCKLPNRSPARYSLAHWFGSANHASIMPRQLARERDITMAQDKTCTKCQQTKPESEFYPTSRGSHCKTCLNKYQKEYRKKNPRRMSAIDKRYKQANREKTLAAERRRKYGITAEDLEALIASQNGLCPGGCGRPVKDVDHSHSSGKIRGILCRNCNLILGHAKDDPQVLEQLAIYLRSRQES